MSVYMPFDPCRHLPVQFEHCSLPVCYRDDAVSGPFIELIRETLVQIPVPLLEMIGSRGFILVLSQLISDVHPEEPMKKPRGHYQEVRYGDVNGMCCVDQRHIHVTKARRFSQPRNIANTLRHELGHAVDHVAGPHIGFGNRDMSATYDFNHAFLADLARLPDAEQGRLAYCIQTGSRLDRSEAFAEAVGLLLGGGYWDSTYFRQHFPQVVAWVEWNVVAPLLAPASVAPACSQASFR